MINKTSILYFKNFFLDLLFPKFCLGCGEGENWLCRECQQKVVLVKTQVCPDCERINRGGEYCPRCRFDEVKIKVSGQKKPKKIKRRKPLQGIIVASYFEEGPIRELVHNFKYNHILEAGEILADLMALSISENLVLDERYVVTSAPLHWIRYARRGYNQAEALGQNVAQKLGLPFYPLLIKKRGTKRQVDLKGKERRENLKNAFALRVKNSLRGKTIIIIDDIATTGATLQECAKVLKSAGAKQVWGLVAARG